MLLGGLGCIIMHFYEIYLRMHLDRAWQLTACSSVPTDACLDVSSSGRDVVPWGTATPGGGILKFCSGVVRTRWDSHGLEAQFVDRGFYLCYKSTRLDATSSALMACLTIVGPNQGPKPGVRFDHHIRTEASGHPAS